ncbi:MAG: folate-binding protein [Xanthomonadales bacterium]|nr:folate-binding protein [Xanthomonadales bacterium]
MTRHALPYLAAARVAGPDAAAFLHAQLSADVAALADGAGGFACHCSPRGQVYGLLLVCRRGPDFLLAGAAGLLPGMLQRLRLFVLRAKVELALAEELAVFGLGGAAETADREAVNPAAGLVYAISAPRDATGGAPEGAADAWKSAELRRGVAWLEPATSERFIPQMLGYDRLGAVSFTKGCYPGQEIIARARYLGKVKRGPLRLLLEDAGASVAGGLEHGSSLVLADGAERLEATLVDHAVDPQTGRAVLFVVAPEAAEPVQSVGIGGRNYRCATM